MGFPVIDPSLGDNAKLYGNMFQCAIEPGPTPLIQKLHSLVETAKKLHNASSKGDHKVVCAFSDIFHYLSSRTSEFSQSLFSSLEGEEIIPCLVNGKVHWWCPNQVFFKSTKEGDDNVTESLFQVIDLSPFLAGVGVKQEVSTKAIFQRMIKNPKEVLSI
jgi:hypothetical protein